MGHRSKRSWIAKNSPRSSLGKRKQLGTDLSQLAINHKAKNFVELVETLVKNYRKLGSMMSLKFHFLEDHINNFKENIGVYSEEQASASIMNYWTLYQRLCNENMTDSCKPVVINLLRLEDHLQTLSQTTTINCAMENCQNLSLCVFISLGIKEMPFASGPPGRCPQTTC